MKTIRITVVIGALLLLFVSATAQANLIDLTPGGFDVNNAPVAFFQFIDQWVSHQFDFFDSATTNGWASQYGILNGGTYFNTSLIGNPGQSTNISWNFSALTGYSMSRILLEGRSADGTAWDNIYSVPANFREFDALETVLIRDDVDIFQISFFGRWPGSPVPDEANTGALLLLAVIAVLLTYDAQRRRNA